MRLRSPLPTKRLDELAGLVAALLLLWGSPARAQFVEDNPAPPPPAPAPVPPPPPAPPVAPAPAPSARPVTPPRPSAPSVPANARATDEEDDPKPAPGRAGRPAPSPTPAVAPAPAPNAPAPARDASKPAARPEHATPLMKLSYRRMDFNNLDSSTLTLNAIQIDMYAGSRKWFRFGTELEIGDASGKTQAGASSTNVYVTSGGTVGFQYPWRVTPFVDFRATGGVMGGDAVGKSAITYTWLVGMDFGVELYIVDRAYLTAAIGWAHPVYRGFDYAYAMAHPFADLKLIDVAMDTWTVKLGIGL